jgi:hypothetical protein
MTCNQKRGVLPTNSTSTTFYEPLTLPLILIFFTLQIVDTQPTATWQPSQHSSFSLTHSHADASQGHFHIASQTMYTPKAQAFFPPDVTKTPDFPTLSSVPLSLKFSAATTRLNYQAQRKIQAFSQDRLATELLTIAMSILPLNFYLSSF